MDDNFKILTWNCCGAFRKKFERIDALDCDVYVIQECEDPSKSADENYRRWSANYLWTGENKNKGLGIFAKKHVQLDLLNWDASDLKYFIPCSVNNNFNLLATWCHGANSPTFGYIGQMWKYLQMHKTKLGGSLIAGDFNSNAMWDKWDRWWNHTDVVNELHAISIESLYHSFLAEKHGQESVPTFHMHRSLQKPYHIDYIFGSPDFQESLKTLEIGKPEDWHDLSDHMPVIASFDLR